MQSVVKLELTAEQFHELLIFAVENEDADPVIRRLSMTLQEKLHRMVERDLYTVYKTAATAEEREAARRRYLDEKGIPESFRW